MSGTSPGRAAVAVPLGLALGATLGLVARGWMRVASADPEFNWAGTVFIVAAFTVWGLAQAIVLAVVRCVLHAKERAARVVPH